MSFPTIPKDQIPYELLRQDEVLLSIAAQRSRQDKLEKAVQHNRLFYTRAKIIFDTVEGTKEVNANIWEVTDNHVMLKGGINLPVCCIREVMLER